MRIGFDLRLECLSCHYFNFATLKDEEAAGSEMHVFFQFLKAHSIILFNFALENYLFLGNSNVCMYVGEQ